MKKRGRNNIMIFYLVVCLTSIILLSLIVRPSPPEPHNLRGYVFYDGSTNGAGGIPVLINNTNSTDTTLTYTLSIPPIIPFIGSYSATINGSDDDIIIITAWNSTHYGRTNTTLISGTTHINLTLNQTRPSELNVSITEPVNNTLYNISTIFNVSANISSIGGQDGVNCNTTISISNNNVLKLYNGETFSKNISSILLGESNLTKWSLIANKTGRVNITVSAICSNSGEHFENLNIDFVYNITVQDKYLPIVNLISPANNTVLTTPDGILITFVYNVTDHSDIQNCTLIINEVMNLTNHTVTKNIPQNFTQNMTPGNYIWQVNCTDNSTTPNIGASGVFNLTILPNLPPTITNLLIAPSIDLIPGGTKKVICNGSVTDPNNISDLIYVNSTFFFTPVGATAVDDNNNHYTNNSCLALSSSLTQINYSCSFDVEYYANNGSWQCNISAEDSENNIAADNTSTKITELLAINLSTLVIDYGSVEAYQTSEDVNITLTNFGNIPINITVEGYADNNGDNLAMNCSKGTIPIGYEKYSIHYNTDYDSMVNLSDTPTQIINLSLPQRTDDSQFASDRNHTYWKLMLPGGIQGSCNGTIIFNTILT